MANSPYRVTINLPEQMFDDLRYISDASQRPMSAVLVEMLRLAEPEIRDLRNALSAYRLHQAVTRDALRFALGFAADSAKEQRDRLMPLLEPERPGSPPVLHRPLSTPGRDSPTRTPAEQGTHHP